MTVAIPTVRMALYALGGAGFVYINGASVSDNSASPAPATAGVTLRSDGGLRYVGDFPVSDPVDQWWSKHPETGIGAGYDARLTVTTPNGPDNGTAVDTWLNLGTSRTWTMTTASGPLSDSGTWLIEIRDQATQVVLDSASFSITIDEEVA